MAHGFKTGGRQVGTPNKNRTALRERLASNYPDYDPLALDLQSRTAEHRLGWYNLETEVGHGGGLTSTFAASKDWGDYPAIGSGANTHYRFGRFESAIRHLHRNLALHLQKLDECERDTIKIVESGNSTSPPKSN